MEIRKLSPELQELCHKRQIEQGNDGTFNGSLSNGANADNFTWTDTPEGHCFWDDLHNGHDVTNSPFYPKSDNVINNYSIY